MIGLFKLGKNKSTKQAIGARNIDITGVETSENNYLIYFLIKPDNIAVLSTDEVKAKIHKLSAVIENVDGIEFSCINSRENFDSNKSYYMKRLQAEKNPKIRELLQKDLAFLDRVQIQMATAREFLFIARIKDYNPENNEVQKAISRMEELLKGTNFIARLATKEDIKRIFSVYFVQDVTQVYYDDYDGQRWVERSGFI